MAHAITKKERLVVEMGKRHIREDKEKNFHPMKFPADTPTYLNRSELPKGLAGGDPVLDALRAL